MAFAFPLGEGAAPAAEGGIPPEGNISKSPFRLASHPFRSWRTTFP